MLFGTENFEFGILLGLQHILKSDVMDFLMKWISCLGNSGAIWIVAALVMLATKKYRRCGVFVGIGLLLGLLLGNVILKNIIARPRPCWLVENVQMLVEMPMDFSFPSGHTLSSFIAAFVMLRRDKRIGFFAFVLASLIAFSRIYLFVHFPTDILGALIIATLIYLGLRRHIRK